MLLILSGLLFGAGQEACSGYLGNIAEKQLHLRTMLTRVNHSKVVVSRKTIIIRLKTL